MTKQWPDNICSGKIRYGKASNYDGFYLADESHGIPTFGSVSPTNTPTIRGQFVNVFNYPDQTEQIAAQLVHRWNMYEEMMKVLVETRSLVAEGAMVGFNPHDGDWAERLFVNQGKITNALAGGLPPKETRFRRTSTRKNFEDTPEFQEGYVFEGKVVADIVMEVRSCRVHLLESVEPVL